MANVTITVPSRYSFCLEPFADSQEDATGFAGGIVLLKLPNGDYTATGDMGDVESWVNERVTNDDPDSTDDIMLTATPV